MLATDYHLVPTWSQRYGTEGVVAGVDHVPVPPYRGGTWNTMNQPVLNTSGTCSEHGTRSELPTTPRLQLVGTEVLQLTERHQLDVLGRLKLASVVVIDARYLESC